MKILEPPTRNSGVLRHIAYEVVAVSRLECVCACTRYIDPARRLVPCRRSISSRKISRAGPGVFLPRTLSAKNNKSRVGAVPFARIVPVASQICITHLQSDRWELGLTNPV